MTCRVSRGGGGWRGEGWLCRGRVSSPSDRVAVVGDASPNCRRNQGLFRVPCLIVVFICTELLRIPFIKEHKLYSLLNKYKNV